MNLFILSDLHLELSEFTRPSAQADVIILAGDISENDNGIYWARKTWPDKPIIYVAGNHEFYRRDRQYVLNNLHIAAEEAKVHFLNNSEIVINGVRFLGSTLWTDFQLFNETHSMDKVLDDCMTYLADFKMIREGGVLFQPQDAMKLFKENVEWLKQKLIDEQFNGKTVVITHHLPSMRSVSTECKNQLSSAGFASHLDWLLGYSELWIHGHTHNSFDYMAGKTRVICNPRGYILRGLSENSKFNSGMVIEV